MLIVVVVVGVLLPLGGIAVAVTSAVRDLLEQVRAALEGHGSLRSVFLSEGDAAQSAQLDWADLVNRYGANAWRALNAVARASLGALIDVVVFVAALYTFAVDGERAYGWLEKHVPIPATALARLAKAFRETGRGLIVGGGGTALVQGALATAAYVAIGIPRAFVLGPITAVCALVPLVGTGLVWVPLAIELGMSGHFARAAAVVVMGTVVGLVDNFIRPVLTRFGRLELPTLVVLVAMLGGIALIGPMGALLGPLVVRLCFESLAIAAEARHGALGASEHELGRSAQ